MITRIIIFLLLLVTGLVIYRLADPTGAQDLLNKIQNLSFSNSKNDSYTTTVRTSSGDVIISKPWTGSTTTPSKPSTGSVASTGSLSPLPLLTQALTITSTIKAQTGSLVSSTGDENDSILDAIAWLINPADTMTGNSVTVTTNVTGSLTVSTQLSTGTGKQTSSVTTSTTTTVSPTPKPSTTPKPKTTTSSSLSQKDRNDAAHFLQFMDIE